MNLNNNVMKFNDTSSFEKQSLTSKWQRNRLFLSCLFFFFFIMLFYSTTTECYAKTKTTLQDRENEISEVLPQPLAEPLPARVGNKTITIDWLLQHHIVDMDAATINWFDNQNILYSVPSIGGNQDREFEIINIGTLAKQTLGTGSGPIASPNKQWIAFVQGENEARQLWMMDRDGQNLKQISHVKDGLFPSNYYTVSFR